MPLPKLDEEAIFDAALQIRAPEARRLYIQQACADNRRVQERVEALIRVHEEDSEFLALPAHEFQERRFEFVWEGASYLIGPYKLIEPIGEGGFGVVFLAEQRQPIQRMVALKIVKPGMDTRQVIARFEVERQALALMDHPNIAKVFDAGTTGAEVHALDAGTLGPRTLASSTSPTPFAVRGSDGMSGALVSGRPYFVMELVKGIPINQYCDEQRLTLRERLTLFMPVCQAIQHAHQKGIIHRDLKPSNVLVAVYDGRPVPKVIDFGVAKALGQQLTEQTLTTSLSGVIGTLEYMSPEQADFGSRDIDSRADIYSLGVLLYELLTGTTPITKERLRQGPVTELLRIIREEEPTKPSSRVINVKGALPSISSKRKLEPTRLTHELRGDLDWIVMKALEKDRDRRYATANGLARDIERFLNEETVEASPPSASYRLRKFARKNRKSLAVAAAFALLLIAGSVVSLWQAVRATKAEHLSNQERDRAEAEAKRATWAERVSNQERDRAEAETKRSRRNLYDAHMRLAQSAWEEGRVKRTLDLLQQHQPNSGDEDLRGFEWHYLRRLTDTAVTTFAGHKGAVWSVVFSPDGRRLATGSHDGTVKVWDVACARDLLTLKGHKDEVMSVAFSPDGKRLASASYDQTVKLWDAESGRIIRTLTGHTNGVVSVAFSPDGKRLASASQDRSVKLWDAASGHQIRTLRGHRGLVASVVFSPDGESIATGGADGLVKVWDTASGKEAMILEGHTGELKSVAFSPDGKRLASGSLDRTVRIWDLASSRIGKLVSPRMILTFKGHADRIFGVAFSPDGKRVASASVDQTLRIWDLASGEETLSLKGHTSWLSSVAFSSDGKWLASASHDKTVKLWDISSGGETMMVIKDRPLVNTVSFSPDGKRLASAGSDPRIKIWDEASGRLSLILSGHTAEVHNVAFSPDGTQLASASLDKTVKVWDTTSGREILTFKVPTGGVVTVAFSPDGKRLAAGGIDKTVRVWDLASGQQTLTLPGHEEAVTSVVFSPDEKRLASASRDGTIKLWDANNGLLVLTLQGHSNAVHGTAFSPDGNRLASASSDTTVKIWDVTSGQELQSLEGHIFTVNCVVFSPDGKRLATASADKTVKVWDTTTGQETLTLKGHSFGVANVAFSPDGQQLASAGFDAVRVWDARPWTSQLRIEQEARNLINLLYANTGQKAEVIRRIEQDSTLSAEVRQEALGMAKRWLEDSR